MISLRDRERIGATLCRRLQGNLAPWVSLDLSTMAVLYGITLDAARDAILEIGMKHGFAIGIVNLSTIEVMTADEASRLLAAGTEIDEIEHYGAPAAPD